MKFDQRMAALAAVVATAMAGSAVAASIKLVEVAPGGETFFVERLPLDRRAFLSADDDGDGIFDFFSITLDGSPPTRLNEPLSDPQNFAFPFPRPTTLSSDGSTIVYGVDSTTGARQLFSVPVDGPATASVRLDLDVAWPLDLNEVYLAGNDDRVVFIGNQQSEDTYELFSVPVDGPAGSMIKLNEPLLSSGVGRATLSPDRQTVVYIADQDAVEPNQELYAVPVDGSSPPVRLSAGRMNSQPLVTATHAVYFLGRGIHSVPLEGPASAAVEITTAPDDGDLVAGIYRLTPDHQTLLYYVRRDGVGNQIWSVPVTGTAADSVQVTPDGIVVRDYKIASDSAMVIYSTNGGDLFSAPIGGPPTSAVRLNQDLAPLNGSVGTFQISPDAMRVVFQGRLDGNAGQGLWSVPITGPDSAGIQLSPDAPANRSVFFDFVISPDSQRVAYRMDLEANDRWDLYSVGIAGPSGSGIKLNGPLAGGGDVCANSANCYRFAPDSRRVVYEAEVDADREVELFIADDGTAAATFVEPALTVFEGSTVILSIDLGAPSVFAVTMTIEQTGGSAISADFTLAGSVAIPPGETTAEVPITLINDTETDGGETLELTITDVENATTGLPFTTVLTIQPEGWLFGDGFE